VDLVQRRSSLSRASFAPWLLAGLLSLNAPAPALAQASQAAPSQAPAAPKTTAANPHSLNGKQFKDWTLHCKTITKGQQEACEMRQNIVNKKGDRVVLVIVGRVPHMDEPGMLILMPLGIALPPGVFFKVDEGQRQPIQPKVCWKEGCRVETLIKSDLLAKLKAGTKAIVTFYVYNRQGKEQEVDVPISLLGFSAALAEVMQSPS
jgi:invasion protein IalB